MARGATRGGGRPLFLWNSEEVPDTSRFLKISKGICADFGWFPISAQTTCEEAAQELGLVATSAAVTSLTEWPEGCHYFPQEGEEKLFLNTNPIIHNNGSSSYGSSGGVVRESICMARTTSLPTSTTAAPEAQAPSTSAGGGAGGAGGAGGTANGVTCEYVVGMDGDNECPKGSVGLIESECRTMPYHFGGLLHTPFEVDSMDDPRGCFFFSPWYYYNTNPLGRARSHRTPYCKRCYIAASGAGDGAAAAGDSKAAQATSVGDWSEWSSASVSKGTSRFRRISMGKCADIGWHAISSTDLCESAAAELGLSDTRATITGLEERPEGCYYFRNYQDGTATLWNNPNPNSRGNGAETSDLAKGMLRQPVCMAKPASTTKASVVEVPLRVPLVDLDPGTGGGLGAETTTTSTVPSRFKKITGGNCASIGGHAINSQISCEAAAREMGLVDTVATVTNVLERPEGCYYFRNYQDLTATLWLNTNPISAGKGAETSDHARGMFRQPICVAQPTTMISTTKYQMISTGRCSDSGWHPISSERTCKTAAEDLGLVHTGALMNNDVIVASLTESPEGCYYFWNSQDGTATLWMNTSPDSVGNGAEASDGDTGLLRQPICMAADPAAAIQLQPPAAGTAGAAVAPQDEPAPLAAQAGLAMTQG